MSNVITLYDIPNLSDTKDKAWSPNTWKTRLALNFKGIPYKTVWVEYPDIENLSKGFGLSPRVVPYMRYPIYTLPMIHDPSTDTAVADSEAIARYLDKTYPDTPRLIPAGTDAFHAAFDHVLMTTAVPVLMVIAMHDFCVQLTPRSEEYFRRTREEMYGKLSELSPPGPIREGQMKAIEEQLSLVARWLEADGVAKPFVMGETISYADLTLAAWLLPIQRILGSREWQTIKGLNGGRWEALIESVAQYAVVP